ncbi:MAG: DegV family protein [Bacillota bacterium]
MSNIHVVTDSTSYISKEFAITNNIDIVPLSIYFEGDTEPEGMPGEFEPFYNRLKDSTDFPKTSQPSVQAFMQVFQKAVDEGKEVVAITISSKLSGTFNSASVAAQQVAPDKISVIDSLMSGPCLRFLTERVLKLANDGKSREEIVQQVEAMRSRNRALFSVGTLDYLKKGGRLSNAQYFIGTLLNIKPVIDLTDGVLLPAGKARGKSKALEIIKEGIPSSVKRISVVHILNIEEAEKFRDELMEIYPNAEFSIDELGPVLGSHLGPMAIGVCMEWE